MGNNNSNRLSEQIGTVTKDTPKSLATPELPAEIWCHIIAYLDLNSLQLCNRVRIISPFIKSILDSEVEQRKITYKLDQKLIIRAAAAKNIKKLKYYHKTGCEIDWKVLETAIESGGSLELVDYCCNYLDTKDCLTRDSKASEELLRFLRHRASDAGWGFYSTASFYASKGELDRLKWLREQVFVWDGGVLRAAVSAGHYHIVKYCYENPRGCPGMNNSEYCFYAALNGHLHVLQYLREKGVDWGETLSGAAESGRVDIMKWAVEQGCPTTHRRVCYNAAARGSLPCLKYAHEVGCPWDNSVLTIALLKKHMDCAEYARANGLIEEED